jgi:isopentenyldiphosphate isomerase
MSNLIDVLSPSGLRTGEILPRAEIHRLGKPHRAVHLYLFNSQNEILLQRRSLTIDHSPGAFSISVTAHVDAGETSFATVRRETAEELGVDVSEWTFEFMFSFYQEATLNGTYLDRQFNDIYVIRADLDPALLSLDPSEVSEIRFVPFKTFHEWVADPSSELAPVYANEVRDLIYFLRDRLPVDYLERG